MRHPDKIINFAPKTELMPKIERWIIDKILDATNIVEVIGDFVELRKTGVNYTGCCPFHDDHHDGNFIVRPEGV